jgi:hypothetical protein
MCKIKSMQSATQPELKGPQDPTQPLPDEVDVDLTGVSDPGPTSPEHAEYLGSYDSVPAYLRAMLEPEVSRACGWILDFLDYPGLQRRWERDGSRLVCVRGQVFRLAGDTDPPEV